MINLPKDTNEIEKVINFLKENMSFIVQQPALPNG